MHRGLFRAGAWALVTAAAAMLSWFGVRSVLRETAYDPPRALAVSAAAEPAPSGSPPAAGGKSSPPSGAPAPLASSPAAPPQHTGTPPASAVAGSVHAYALAGGRVVLDLAPASASLVSATPAAGWQMKVWTQRSWLRVTFTSPSGARATTLMCAWNGHPPAVQTFEDD